MYAVFEHRFSDIPSPHQASLFSATLVNPIQSCPLLLKNTRQPPFESVIGDFLHSRIRGISHMKRIVMATAVLAVATGPVCAQQSTAVGIGQAKSTSISAAKSTAIGVGGTAVGGGVGNTGTVNVTNNPTAAIIAGSTPANSTQTITTQGKTSVSTVPSVFAPGLAAAGIESCLGSVSGGGSWLGTGITLGGSIPDKDCSARLDARTLWSFGLKKAAVARLCQTYDIYASMPEVCGQYVPRPAPAYAPVAVQATYASVDTASLPSGTIMLIEGRTGRERPCSNYDEAHSR